MWRTIIDNSQPNSWAGRLRRKRMALFWQVAQGLPTPLRVLDVGGEARFWQVVGLAGDARLRITLLNQSAPPVTHAHMHSVAGDAADLSAYAPGDFELVFSNSVIEHLGSWERQQRMAAEVRRVAQRYLVQTPNRYFPIEPHFLLPGFQFYPRRAQVWLTQHFALGWYARLPERRAAERLVDEHRLLSPAEMQRLFPDAVIQHERILGCSKSLMAYRI